MKRYKKCSVNNKITFTTKEPHIQYGLSQQPPTVRKNTVQYILYMFWSIIVYLPYNTTICTCIVQCTYASVI